MVEQVEKLKGDVMVVENIKDEMDGGLGVGDVMEEDGVRVVKNKGFIVKDGVE